MPKASQALKLREGLPWTGVLIRSKRGAFRWHEFVLDSGSSHTILHTRTALALGYTERLGTALFDSPAGPIEGDTTRVSSLIVFGREVKDYLVGLEEFQTRFDVAGILGLDFFSNADLSLRFRTCQAELEW